MSTDHRLIYSEAFVDQDEPVASISEFAPDKPDLTPEQDLRAAVADMLANAIHFGDCKANADCDCGYCRCTCLLGRLNWAINADTTTTEGQATS